MAFVTLLLPLLLGCTETCDAPRVLDGRTYEVFGNLVRFDSIGVGVPPEDYPVNGSSRWTLAWGASDDGPVDVTIDDQPQSAIGSWNPTTCNTFDLAIDGVYTSPGGVRHVFSTSGEYLFYDDVLEGELTWSDRWTFGESSGSIEAAEAVIVGILQPLAL